MLTRLQISTTALMLGISPFLVSRRSRASAALRYWVGSTPNCRKAASPAGQGLDLAQRGGANFLQNPVLLCQVSLLQALWRGPVG